ncbi:hypothetical protein [Hymenobacter sp. AT01-02]|nr:hypothetical protein [Hymenobacter sp. AT01-02]
MGSFFAEVYYDAELNHMHDCKTFVSTTRLEPYTNLIELPIK